MRAKEIAFIEGQGFDLCLSAFRFEIDYKRD
jgi:hypothetical protein